ncbi:MAG: hypothetical protein JFR41_06365 [Muribaculaceae bacterium]|nr:hypothetical protein [Muribaculaceae bacterium]
MIRRLSLLFSLLMGLSATVSALPVSYYASSSRLAGGNWVKIRTDKEAIYQFTYDQLRGMGFSNPQKVQVYGYGALTLVGNQFSQITPDDLQPIATRHTADGRILFFGEGDVCVSGNNVNRSNAYFTYRRSQADRYSYYFLSDAEDVTSLPMRAQGVQKFDSAGNPIETASHLHIDWQEDELQNPSEGGVTFHGKKYSPGDQVPFSFHIKNYRPLDSTTNFANGSFAYVFALSTPVMTSLSASASSNVELVQTSATLNSPAVVSANSTVAYENATGWLPFTSSDSDPLQDSEVTFTVSIPTANTDKLTYTAADRVYLTYPRANVLDAEDPYLVMNLMDGRNYMGHSFVFEGVMPGDVEMWNIDTPTAINSYPPVYDAERDLTKFILDRQSFRAVAFNPTYTFPTPEVVESVEPQDLHAASTPDMLLITTAELLPYAERIAALHRTYQDMDVLVVEHNLIFNEFSSGARSSMAYRRMAKMFYDRDPKKFKHVFFFGPSSYDNRCIEVTQADRLVSHPQPDAKQSNNAILNYPIDSFFGMLNDKFSTDNSIEVEPVQVAVGRVPALNVSQAATYVDKVERYFKNPLPAKAYARTLLIGGAGDNDTHGLHQLEVRDTMSACRKDFAHTYVSFELLPKNGTGESMIANALTEGVGYMTYSGHGGPTYIDGFDVTTVNSLHYDSYPFVMLASCDQFAFDRMHGGLVEAMLFERDGGAIGGFAAARSVYISYNQMSCLPTAVAYANAKPGAVYGDLFKTARNSVISGYKDGSIKINSPTIVFRNMLAYNLAGDPALPLRVPERKAAVTKMGQTGAGKLSIAPFVPTTVEGCIYGSNGAVDASFNGTAEITLYDGAHDCYIMGVKRPLGNNMIQENDTITFDNDVLSVVSAKVVNGKFTAEMSVPNPTYPDGLSRMLVTATSDDGTGAMGTMDNVKVTAYDENEAVTDFKAPVIKQFYLTDADKVPASEINGSGYVVAVIDPTAEGLNFRTGTVASSPRMIVDGLAPSSIAGSCFVFQENGEYIMTYPVSNLSEGAHTVELLLASNAGMAANAKLDFNVITRSLTPEVVVAESPASTQATIDVQGAGVEYSRMLISDERGNTVFSVENPRFPYQWNLKDAAGSAVADGTYKVSVLVRNGRYYGHSAQSQIVVLR